MTRKEITKLNEGDLIKYYYSNPEDGFVEYEYSIFLGMVNDSESPGVVFRAYTFFNNTPSVNFGLGHGTYGESDLIAIVKIS